MPEVQDPGDGPADDAGVFAELYDLAPCGFLTIGPTGAIQRSNATFARWIGCAPADLVGTRRFQDLLTGGGRIYFDTHFAPLLHLQGEIHEVALDLRCDDGTTIPTMLNAVKRPSPSGDLTLITVFDASDRRRYEQHLLATQRQAEAVAQRAAFIARIAIAMDAEISLARRAQTLVDSLVPELAAGATVTVHLADGASVVRSAGEPARGDMPQVVVALPRGARVVGNLRLWGEPSEPSVGVPGMHARVGFLAGMALDNARLYDQEHRVALVLQHSLLATEAPVDDRFAVVSRYEPATAALEVGGDWHDAFMLDDDRLALLVGDVVGHGLDAAATMGQLRSAIRALAMTADGPGPVLDRLDDFVTATGVGYVATVVYAEVEVATGHTEYACAGHPPPLHICTPAPPRLLMDGRSAPLGVRVSDGPRPTGSMHLDPGDRLLLYTDGLIERRDASIDEDLHRLQTVAESVSGGTIEELADGLLDALLVPGTNRDDVCLLALAFDAAP